MSTVQMYGNGVGGVFQGNYGTYQATSDGTFTIDARDITPALLLGMTYVNKTFDAYYTGGAPAAASAAAYVSSASLSNGNLTIAAQPDVTRQAALVVGTGTTAVTAGSIALTYIANDGTTQTDTFSAVVGASATTTQFTSKGVVHIASGTVSGLVGGTSPFVYLGSTSVLSVPVSPGATDFSVQKENVTGADETVGTLSTVTLGSIAPTSAPNGTRTYSFMYTYYGPGF